jgi:pilus assembly protein CpaC
VTYDLQAIQTMVDGLFPGEDVSVQSVHSQVVLTGTASSADVASKIANVVGHYVSEIQELDGKSVDELIANLIETRGEQQVMLKVRIVEATRNVLRELGLETNLNDANEAATSTIFGSTQPSSFLNGTDSFTLGTNVGLSQDPVGVGRIIADTGLRGIGEIGLFLEALEEENLANILAEPNLTTVSGEQAGFLAGGEFPVPVGRDNVGNVVVEFREFGVSLNFRPIVMSGELISMQMNTEVSSLDFENAVVLADLTVPGRDIRRAETTVEMPSGASLMIAGLLQSEAVKGMSGLPGISKTPVLGDLVSSHSFERNETELIVIVTPYLVKPYADEKVVERVPEQRTNHLAQAFATNIRREYDTGTDLFSEDDQFGYLLD